MELSESYKLEPKLTELDLAHRVLDMVVNLLLMFQSPQRSYNTLVSNLRVGIFKNNSLICLHCSAYGSASLK